MSTIATLRLVHARRAGADRRGCRTAPRSSNPESASSRAIPSRRRTVSSASATVMPAPSIEIVLRSGGKSRGRSSASSWWIRSGVGEALEPELSEISRGMSVERGERLGGDEDLAPVTGVRDPRCAHDVDARVPLVAERRRAGVQSDANAHANPARPLGVAQRALDRERRRRAAEPGVANAATYSSPDGVRLEPPPRGDDRLAQRAAEERDRVRVVHGASRCSAVEPSTSAKRNVTVPVGSAFTGGECISSCLVG